MPRLVSLQITRLIFIILRDAGGTRPYWMAAGRPPEFAGFQIFASACCRSAMRSGTSSRPRAMRTRLSTMPMDSRYSAE